MLDLKERFCHIGKFKPMKIETKNGVTKIDGLTLSEPIFSSALRKTREQRAQDTETLKSLLKEMGIDYR